MYKPEIAGHVAMRRLIGQFIAEQYFMAGSNSFPACESA